MSRPRPKFCVGEEVMLRTPDFLEYNTDRTEITECCWEDDVWAYGLTHLPSHLVAKEYVIFKIPPQYRLSFNDCVWQPEKEGADAA